METMELTGQAEVADMEKTDLQDMDMPGETFDDLFEESSGYGNEPFDRDAWKEKKQAERQSAFALADSTALEIFADGAKFQTYLDVQARFINYTATNALLIYAQKPDATKIRSFESWKDMGASIRKGNSSFSIIEPGNEYQRDDGSIGTSWNVKKMFDISQTTERRTERTKETPDERTLLKALLRSSPVPVVISDELPGLAHARYDHEKQQILARRGMDAHGIFLFVSKEIALAEAAQGVPEYKREDYLFTSYCTAYILCKRYGIDTGTFDFAPVEGQYRDKNAQELKVLLSEVSDTAKSIARQMDRPLEQTRTAKSKGQER